MPAADYSTGRVAYVAEATYGTTPATPTFKTWRTTQVGSMRTNKGTTVSDEIRADRNVSDVVMVSQGASGSYPVEMSYGTYDDFLEAALFGAWATNVLKNGVTPKSFTLEETVQITGGSSFSRFTGVMVDQFDLSLSAGEKVTGSIALKGQKETLGTAIVTGATYTAATTEPIMNATANVATLSVPNVTGTKLKSLSLSVKNNLRDRFYLGSLYSDQFGAGRCEVTGEFLAYFTEQSLYDAVLSHGGGALSFTIGAAANKKYTFSLPKIIFGDGEKVAGGHSTDIMARIPFQAVYDSTAACSIQITRAVA